MEVVGREGCISHGASKAYVALSPFLFPSFFTPAHVHSSRQIKKAYKCLCDWSFVNMPAANLNRQANVYFLVLIPFGEVGAADRCPKAHGVRRRAANAMEVSARAAPHISFSLLPILLNFRFTYLLSLVCLFPFLIVNSFFQCKPNTCVHMYACVCLLGIVFCVACCGSVPSLSAKGCACVGHASGSCVERPSGSVHTCVQNFVKAANDVHKNR